MHIEKWILKMASEQAPANFHELAEFGQKVINEYRATCADCDNNPCKCAEIEANEQAEASEMASMKSLYDAEVRAGIHVPASHDDVLLANIEAEQNFLDSVDLFADDGIY